MKTFLSILLLAVLSASSVFSQAFNDFQVPPHNYNAEVPDDPMTRLILRAEAGDYDFGTKTGLPLVKKLLADLDIPESSQILVFSQTSLQRELIGPDTIRGRCISTKTLT